jgi:hypothetical protein
MGPFPSQSFGGCRSFVSVFVVVVVFLYFKNVVLQITNREQNLRPITLAMDEMKLEHVQIAMADFSQQVFPPQSTAHFLFNINVPLYGLQVRWICVVF